MKRTISIITIVLTCISGVAQNDDLTDLLASSYAAQIHQDSIDQSHLLVMYNYQCQTEDADGKSVVDQMKMALQVGTHCTRSYPYWKYLEHNEGWDPYGNEDEMQILYNESYTFVPEVWTNHPDDKVTVRDNILPNIYETCEKRVPLKWTLIDDTLTVCGYLCHSATTTLHGKTWMAYYTEEIPSSAGPWKLNGLPGLILHAVDAEQIHAFTAEAIQSDGSTIYYEHNAITNKIAEAQLIKQKNRTFGNARYVRNPTYYIDKNIMYKDADIVYAGIGNDFYFSLINGIIEKQKAHKYQPLELK